MALVITGINYKSAEVELREKVSFSNEEIISVLSSIKQDTEFEEAMILSTCNRTEFYICYKDCEAVQIYITNLLSRLTANNSMQLENYLYRYIEKEAVYHLFRVVSGLDSMIIGENQIFNQIKQSYKLSCIANTNGVVINKLLHWAFKVGKRVRNETDIGKGAVSVSSAAVELTKKIFSDLSKHSILLIGAGEAAKLTAENLKNRGIKKLLIVNRTYSKAVSIAKIMEAEPVKWEDIKKFLSEVDIIISCTGAKKHLFYYDDIKVVMDSRKYLPLFIIDIAVPRDFEPSVGRIKNVFLYTIDDLRKIAEKNLEKRKNEIPKSEAIIKHETDRFIKWYKTLSVTPLIADIQRKIEKIRLEELNKNKRHFQKDEWENLDLLTKSIVKKIIKIPLLKIKEYNEEPHKLYFPLETIKDIFQVGDNKN